MREELVALAKLAEMDDSARDIENELKQIPEHLEELRTGVQTLESMLAQEREQLNVARQLKIEQSGELKERTEGLQRARKKAAQATSAREADAGEREIEANRRAIKEREDELARIGQAIEAKEASLAEREKDFEEAKGVLQSEEESSKTRIAELEVERGKLLNGRDELVVKIPKTVVKRYDRLRTGIPNAVIIIKDGTCSACRMALPPQLGIELQRADALHQCPHCRRIIIHKKVIED
ncbi:MAG: C4-type zinc ribbon domain-containing protein [Myxococcales bacterium]|nr:C4-type zinc ribbon domain-containing protein [Myxococcales bacterium]